MRDKFVSRLLKLPLDNHILLFGPRNSGKSTLLKETFDGRSSLYIDLLDGLEEDRFRRNPDDLFDIVMALPDVYTHVIIDEVQKVPKLLDVVHRLMGQSNKKFILSGSSARKLKHGGANLLAGRALVYNLHPFSYFELDKEQFELSYALQWGMLPEMFQYHAFEKRQKFLQSYANTYLKEEIWGEHFIRKLDPFRQFLEVAAQCNGKIINFSNIARDVGVDDKTVRNYYSILEDTLIGFFLEPFHRSVRKRLAASPKFYFFDTGVARALARLTSVPLESRTHAFGNAFEHFILLEIIKLCSYYHSEYRFSYLRTRDDVEIDLIIDRPGMPLLCIEIKSGENIGAQEIKSFITITKDISNSESVCLCREKYAKKVDHVLVLPWQLGLEQFFLPSGNDQ